MAKTPLTVAGIVFSLVALLHLSRLVFKFDFSINGAGVPLWANGLGLVIAALLAAWMLKTAKKV